MITRRAVLAAAAAGLVPAAMARAQTANDGDTGSPLDALFKDAESALDRQFEAASAAIDADIARVEQSMREVYARFDRDLARHWGDERRLPERKVWIAYPDGLETRVIVDYETGEIRVEVPDGPDADARLQALMQRVLSADSARLDSFDEAANRLRAEIGGDTQVMAPPPPAPEYTPEELGKLVVGGPLPEPERRTLTDAAGNSKVIKSAKKKFVPDYLQQKAEDVRDTVVANAGRFKLPPSLVVSVIHNESSFNPRAQSPVPAFGLMQLVPSTGGLDSYRFVHGEDKAPSPDYLFQPAANIELGAAYLHILDSRYLAAVENPESRLYCVISAYNTGAGNVARAFGAGRKVRLAAATINTMEPQQVYEHLQGNLPYEETRRYIVKVVGGLKRYAGWDRPS